jgi:photosystem II stability/assembly factor-like uncharacterized protein
VSFLTRRRLVIAGLVAAFVAVFAAIGALSKSSDTAMEPAVAEPIPTAEWYWAMTVSPSDPDVLLVATSGGLVRSENGGRSWRQVGPEGLNATSVARVGETVVAAGALLPRRASPIVWKGSSRVASDGPAVVAASTDEGETWRTLRPRGLPFVTVQALVSDPGDEETLYALLNDGRLYRSTDEARSFELASPRLGAPPWALAITPEGRYVAGNMDSGYYTSADGTKWQNMDYEDSKGERHVMEFAVKPDDPTRLLMTSTGVELSTDGGTTWQVALESEEMFGPVAWAPGEPDRAYAVGFDRSVWRTDDGGETWEQVT